MKKSLGLISVFVCALIFSGMVTASQSVPLYSGEYLFTADLDKYNPATETEALQSWLGEDIQLQFHSKLEDFTEESLAGTSSGFGEQQNVYYGVKAGDSIAFFSLEGLLDGSLNWSTIENFGVGKKGNQPGISHLSVWTTGYIPLPFEIPEPSTLTLLAFGLVGLVSINRTLKK